MSIKEENFMEEKYVYICFTPTEEHLSLILDVNDLYGGQDMGQQAALQQAISYFTKLAEERPEEIEGILRRAARTKVRIRQNIGEIPKSLKVRVDKNAYERAESLFMDALGLVQIRKPYFARVILMNYYLRLQEENRELGVSVAPGSQSVVTSIAPVKEEGQHNSTDAVCDTPERGEDETLKKLQRLKEYGIVADMLLRSAPEDETYIQEILKIAKRRGR